MLESASMTTNLKAIYEKGILRLQEPLPLPEGAEVEVSVSLTEPENGKHSQKTEAQSWDTLAQLLNECAIDTGVSDLAQQHDHYLYGLTKNIPDADSTR